MRFSHTEINTVEECSSTFCLYGLILREVGQIVVLSGYVKLLAPFNFVLQPRLGRR